MNLRHKQWRRWRRRSTTEVSI